MPNFETSFIPEQGTTYQTGARRSTVATVFSILIALAAGGVSAYAWWLEQQELAKVKTLEAELSSMESRFNIGKISQLAEMDRRISVARDMLNKHPLPSMIIDYLAENTVSSIKWKSTVYNRANVSASAGDSNGSSGDTLDLTGETIGYSPLYQQLVHFRTRCKEITSVELKSFSMDPRTNILTIQMRVVINPNYATVATMRAKNAPPPEEVIPSDNLGEAIPESIPSAPEVNPATVAPTAPSLPKNQTPNNVDAGDSSMPAEDSITSM